MGFVGETNYYFVERLMFLGRLHHRVKPAAQKFHAKLLRERKRGTFASCNFANKDQTHLPFVLDNGRTCDAKCSEDVWFSSGKSGLDNRQSSIQLTVFADGIPRVRPTIIFRREGKHIKASEKGSWDKRVKVYFQNKVWCDEQLMKGWACDEWDNIFTNPPPYGSARKIIVTGVHRAQQTDPV